MTESAAEWLAANTIECAPLSARITAEQCRTNQGHTYACESCPRGGRKYDGPRKAMPRRKRSEPVSIAVPPAPVKPATPARPLLPPPQPEKPRQRPKPAPRGAVCEAVPPEIVAQILARVQQLISKKRRASHGRN